ncbi:MAG: hypothetical protein RLY61_383 [Candidatus Parcubacteria bacterium]|jgi:D-alanine-D-alanine ligase
MSLRISSSKKTLAVLFGGISPEHEVSVITGLQVANNADVSKYNILPIYISKEGKWFTGSDLINPETYRDLQLIPTKCKKVSFDVNIPQHLILNTGLFNSSRRIKIDVAFPCFHGGFGENGALQGLLDMLEIPYVGSDTLGSSVGMDKVVMKQLLEQNSIKVAPYIFFFKDIWVTSKIDKLTECENMLKYPMFVKPASSGSSIGISKVNNRKELENAIDVAFAFDRKVIVETGIEGFKEINVSVVGISGNQVEVSECEEVFASKDFLNYEDKYVGENGASKGMVSAKREIPAKISMRSKLQVQEIAKKAFTVLNAGGLARVDLLLNDESGECYLIEINTIPGSMSFYLWEATNKPFRKLIDELIGIAISVKQIRSEKTTTFSSNILKDFRPSLKSSKLGR